MSHHTKTRKARSTAPHPRVATMVSTPTNMCALLTSLQAMRKRGYKQDSIIGYVYQISAHLGIRPCRDQYVVPQESPAPAKPKPKSKRGLISVPLSAMMDGPYQVGIGNTFSITMPNMEMPPARPTTSSRIVLSPGRRRDRTPALCASLVYECNGLVIDANTWKALAVHPRSFNPQPSSHIVNELLADNVYDIIRVDDGTVVTLYSWEHPIDGPTWSLATGNAYDVSSLNWIGDMTYAEIFYDLATRLYPDFVSETGITLVNTDDGGTKLEFKNLSRTVCYTVGFRHHNFHPMTSDPERMWQIQSTNLATPSPEVVYSGNNLGLPGIPDQKVYAVPSKLVGGQVPTMENLNACLSSSIEDAEKYITSKCEAGPSLPDKINYGYILRSRNTARSMEYSDILIESPLLTRIRKIVYARSPRSVRSLLNADDRLEYNAMRAFLTANARNEFLALYPDWRVKFNAYESFTNNIINIIISALRNREIKTTKPPNYSTATGRVAQELLAHICKFERLDPHHTGTLDIVRDYVVSPEYTLIFMRALRK